jgi:hypothetical protein
MSVSGSSVLTSPTSGLGISFSLDPMLKPSALLVI